MKGQFFFLLERQISSKLVREKVGWNPPMVVRTFDLSENDKMYVSARSSHREILVSIIGAVPCID